MQGIPAAEQRLILDGVELQDWHTLAHHSIAAGSEVHLVLRLPPSPAERAAEREVAKQQALLEAERARALAKQHSTKASGGGSIQGRGDGTISTPLLPTPASVDTSARARIDTMMSAPTSGAQCPNCWSVPL